MSFKQVIVIACLFHLSFAFGTIYSSSFDYLYIFDVQSPEFTTLTTHDLGSLSHASHVSRHELLPRANDRATDTAPSTGADRDSRNFRSPAEMRAQMSQHEIHSLMSPAQMQRGQDRFLDQAKQFQTLASDHKRVLCAKGPLNAEDQMKKDDLKRLAANVMSHQNHYLDVQKEIKALHKEKVASVHERGRSTQARDYRKAAKQYHRQWGKYFGLMKSIHGKDQTLRPRDADVDDMSRYSKDSMEGGSTLCYLEGDRHWNKSLDKSRDSQGATANCKKNEKMMQQERHGDG